MTTRCPCPAPPGGAVTCEGRQFAYCHIVNGRVESGCIPIPPMSARRPTPNTIQPLFEEVIDSIGLPNLLRQSQSVSIFTRGDEHGSPEGRILSADHDLPEFLYTCMQQGWVVAIASESLSPRMRGVRFIELLIRFPSIWSRADREPELLARPLLER